MKKLGLVLTCLLLGACGRTDTITEVKEICSADSPAITLPDEVVCNHAPANNVRVDGREIVYMCTKIKGRKK